MTTESDAAIGLRARTRRLEMERSLKDVAAQVGIHFTTLGKLETGKMRFTTSLINRVADALSSDYSWLAWGVYEPDISYISVFDNIDLDMSRPLWPVCNEKVLYKLPTPEIPDDAYCFGLRVENDLDPIEKLLGPWVMVIDPSDNDVKSGSMYAMVAEGKNKADFVVPSSKTLTSCLWPSGETLRYGERRFYVLGKVVYQSRNLGIPYLYAPEDEGTDNG